MQLLVCLHSTEHMGHFELTRIFWTLEPMQGMGVPSNSLALHGYFTTKGKRCHVCRDFTVARCDHRANNCRSLNNVSKNARACSIHALHDRMRQQTEKKASSLGLAKHVPSPSVEKSGSDERFHAA